MKILKKSLAVLLTVAMMLGSISVAASAIDDPDPLSPNNLTVTVKLYRQIDGEWVETNRAKPGETLQARYFVGTEYYTNAFQPGFAFDKKYFTIEGKTAGDNGDLTATQLKPSYLGDAFQMSRLEPMYLSERNNILRLALRDGLIQQEDVDANGYVTATIQFGRGVMNQKLDESEYLLQIDQITVSDSAYVRQDGQIGVFYTPEALVTTVDRSRLYNFPKGANETGSTTHSSALKSSGDGWDVSITDHQGWVSVFTDFVLDANGGVFRTGTTQAATKTITAGVIGEAVGDTNASAALSDANKPTFTGNQFKGWALDPASDEVLTFDEIKSIPLDYEDVTLYAIWTPLNEGEFSYDINYYYMQADGEYPAEPITETVANVGSGVYQVPKTAPEGYVFDEAANNNLSVVVESNGNVSDPGRIYFKRAPYTLTYNWTDAAGNAYDDLFPVLYGAELPESAVLTDQVPAPVGYSFIGWSKTQVAPGEDTTLVDPASMTMPAEDLDLYAVYQQDVYRYVFDAAEGTFSNGERFKVYEYHYGDLPETVEEPAREGYAFVTWDNDYLDANGNPIPVTGDLEFEAAYDPDELTLDFVDADGNTLQHYDLKYDDEITESYIPGGYEGYDWSDDGAVVDFPFTLTKNTVLKAEPQVYEAWFFVDDAAHAGEPYAITRNPVDEEIALPEDPVKEGYTFLMWDPEALGSIQVPETLYFDAVFDPASFNLVFDANGGAFEDGSDRTSEILEFGTDVTAPAIPTRDGYTFLNWSEEVPATMPGRDVTLVANWQAEQHKVTFDANGGAFSDGTQKQTVTDYTDAPLTAPTATRDGYTFDGWMDATGADATVPASMPAADATFLAKWTPEQHSISFFADENATQPSEVLTGNTDDPVEPPVEDPTREGSDFAGWVDKATGEPVDVTEFPAEDIEVIPSWTTHVHNAIFNANGGAFADGEAVKVQPYEYGADITAPAEPTRDGYDFQGWEPVPAQMPDEDVTFTAQWLPTATGTASYIINVYYLDENGENPTLGRTQVSSTESGDTIEITADPAASNADIAIDAATLNASNAFELDPDYPDSVLKITATEGAENVLNAYFKMIEFEVWFDENDGDIDEGDNYAIGFYGDPLVAPEVSREGYTFQGWMDESGRVTMDVPSTITENQTYTAQWEKNSYPAIFNVENEDGDIVWTETVEIPYGETVADYEPTYEVPDGYTFTPWEIYADETMPAEEVTYTGSIEAIPYTLTYVVNGDRPAGYTVPEALEGLTVGATVTLEDVPSYTGYEFDGWKIENAPYAPGSDYTMEAKNVTVVGTFKAASYILNFDPAGGDAIEAQMHAVGDAITVANLPVPTREGYTFEYWKLDGAEATDFTMPARNVTLVAEWQANDEVYELTLDANGGEFAGGIANPYRAEFTENAVVTTPAAPTRDGYKFTGWTDADLGVAAEIPARMPARDVNLRAEWAELHDVTYVDEDGNTIESFPNAGVAGDPLPNVPAPEKDGYTFTGWVNDAGTPVTAIPEGDVTLHPTYEENVPGAYLLRYYDADGTTLLNAVQYAPGADIDSYQPTKDGYTFDGWDGMPADGKMPAQNLDVTAKWIENQIPVHSATFNLNGGNIAGDSSNVSYDVEEGAIIPKPEDPVKTGYTFLGWEPTPASMGTEDLEFVAKWAPVAVTVVFDLNGGNVDGDSNNVTVRGVYDEALTAPTPVKAGYTFNGWDSEVPEKMPAENATFTAQWIPIDYTITYADFTGDVPAGVTTPAGQTGLHAGDKVTLAPVTVPDGYRFVGWTYGNVTYKPNTEFTMPAENVTFTGVYENMTHHLMFDTDFGSFIPSVDHKTGDPIVIDELPVPTKPGYTFQYWEKDGAPATDFLMPGEHVTLKAIWAENPAPTYTATFKLEGGNVDGSTEDVVITGLHEGDAITAPTPVKDGYTFDGWDPAVDAAMPANNVTYTAKWTENPAPTYTATFKLEGGNVDGSTEDVVITGLHEGDAITAPTPVKDGYTFDGWDPAVDAAMPANNVTYTAKWTENPAPTYTATFKLEGGNVDGATEDVVLTLHEGDAITAPAPVKDGYTFLGWDPEVDAAMPAHNTAYTALWEEIPAPTYTATFKLEGGNVDGATEDVVLTLHEGDAITAPAPVKDGYTFDGWDPEVDATMPASNTTYTAKWVENAPDTHTITYYLAKGDDTPYDTDTVKVGDPINPPTPTAEGMEFKGWVDEDGNPIPDTMGDHDITAYATFDPITYTVTYVNEGNVYQTYPVPYGAEIPVPADPESANPDNIFAGWDPAKPATMPASDLSFNATYIEREKGTFIATYLVDGNTYEAYNVKEGDPIPVPVDPQKFGKIFTGWNPEVPAEMPANDVTFEAQFEIDPTFVAIVIGGTVIAGTAVATAIGVNAALITGASIIGGVLVIAGAATLAKHTHKVTYLVDGEVYRTYLVVEGTKVPTPKDPSKDGATFQGWNPEVPEKMPNSDLTFEAEWSDAHAPADVNVEIPQTGSAAGIAAFTAISGAAAAAFLFMKKKKDEE